MSVGPCADMVPDVVTNVVTKIEWLLLLQLQLQLLAATTCYCENTESRHLPPCHYWVARPARVCHEKMSVEYCPYTSIHMSIHMSVHMSIHMSTHMYTHMSIHMSIHMAIHMAIHNHYRAVDYGSTFQRVRHSGGHRRAGAM